MPCPRFYKELEQVLGNQDFNPRRTFSVDAEAGNNSFEVDVKTKVEVEEIDDEKLTVLFFNRKDRPRNKSIENMELFASRLEAFASNLEEDCPDEEDTVDNQEDTNMPELWTKTSNKSATTEQKSDNETDQTHVTRRIRQTFD